MTLLQLAPGMKGEFSRQLRSLIQQRFLSFDGESYYLEPDPPPYDPQNDPNAVASTRNWHVAGLVASTRNLPSDPVARAEAESWLNDLSTHWKNDHKEVKTRYRELLRQGCSDRGIIIVFKELKEREETAAAALSESQPAAAGSLPPDPDPEPLPEPTPQSSEPTLEDRRFQDRGTRHNQEPPGIPGCDR
jgi:hypothetical protein